MTLLDHLPTHEDFDQVDLTPDDVYQAWLEDLSGGLRQDLTEMGLLVEYWEGAFICLGEDLHYALMGEYPMGFPYSLAGAIEALGVGSEGPEADWNLWVDMIRCGFIEPAPVEGAVVAYYRHPMLDPGVPALIQQWHPHKPLVRAVT